MTAGFIDRYRQAEIVLVRVLEPGNKTVYHPLQAQSL